MNGLDAVKDATWGLHVRAERSGIIADILAGRATRLGVALLLRNLLPVYQVLDASGLGRTELVRSAAIGADLAVLSPGTEVALLPEGAAYAERVGRSGSAGLLGHAYVRYLGDLNGGRIMQRRLVACLGPLADELRFHDYPGLPDTFTAAYREELDRAVRVAGVEAVVPDAVAGFEMNIALSEAVRAVAYTNVVDL